MSEAYADRYPEGDGNQVENKRLTVILREALGSHDKVCDEYENE